MQQAAQQKLQLQVAPLNVTLENLNREIQDAVNGFQQREADLAEPEGGAQARGAEQLSERRRKREGAEGDADPDRERHSPKRTPGLRRPSSR